jgi:hypothetical protein
VISALEVSPLSGRSSVNGRKGSFTFPFERSGSGSCICADTLHLSGVHGFGLSAWDYQGGTAYRVEPFSTILTVNGDTLYRLENREFSYHQSGQIRFEFNRYGSGWSGRFRSLFRKEGNSLPYRSGPGTVSEDAGYPGSLSLDKSVHRAEITVSDMAGNISSAHFYFRMHSCPEIRKIDKLTNSDEVIISSVDPDGGRVIQKLFESEDGGKSWTELTLEEVGSYGRAVVSSLEQPVYRYTLIDDEGMRISGTFSSPAEKPGQDMVFADCSLREAGGALLLDIITDRTLSSPPGVRLFPGISPAEVIQTGEMRYEAVFEPGSISSGENLFHIEGTDYRGYPLREYHASRIYLFRSGSEFEWAGADTMTLRFVSDSVSQPSLCIISSYQGSVPPDSGRVQAVPPFRLRFRDDNFLEPMRIYTNAGEKIGFYRYDEDDSTWSCLGDAGSGSGITISRPGVFALFRDGLPPRIGRLAISENPSGSGFFRDYSYFIPVEDSASGIDPYSPEILWNGEWMLCRWDDIRGRLYIPVPSSIPSGKVYLRAAVSDKLGNRSVENFSFVIE